ncbi:MAG: DUF2179 domain-containing protein [Balneolaceae bacterium]
MAFLITPFLIFIARIADVSLGTLRITMVSRGYKLASAILGFFEVLIWVIVVAQVLANLDNWINYIAYAGGFSAGTYIGLYLEDKVKMGTIMIRIITQDKSAELIEALKSAGMAVTSINAQGGFQNNDVKVIFTVLKRRKWTKVLTIIDDIDPEAFFSSEDVKYSNKHHNHLNPPNRSYLDRMLRIRKGL